ncbi:C-C motif chemokine 4-like isoform X1 [Dicentrarchus labrax]|uniref:C-C motif chemokine 4-like isoform X1 n=2 Tax=Dicentrarchus labrax TaxID=13489 RepID=UPI0021F65EFF|nr:C-C motif chemokine 4-like isoform X1 [Dicentrarchus labrax]
METLTSFRGFIQDAVLTLHHHHHHHHLTDSIMRTLCLTLGLLLLAACCCNAMPKALKATAPAICCFSFSKRPLPLKLVSDITKTHSFCQKQAFVVQTIKGRQICYSETFQWALDVYNKLHNTEGSGLQH